MGVANKTQHGAKISMHAGETSSGSMEEPENQESVSEL